jgi:hypothetical protein
LPKRNTLSEYRKQPIRDFTLAFGIKSSFVSQKTSEIRGGTSIAMELLSLIHSTAEGRFILKKSPYHLLSLLGFFGLCLAFQGILVVAQSTLESQSENGWRRTTQGWEHADSLPISTNGMVEQSELRFPTLSITLDKVHRVQRLVLPLAIAGFMACFGPWLLMRWPTLDGSPSSTGTH